MHAEFERNENIKSKNTLNTLPSTSPSYSTTFSCVSFISKLFHAQRILHVSTVEEDISFLMTYHPSKK